jgi:hypothetical protein
MSQIPLFCILFCHYYVPDSAVLSIILLLLYRRFGYSVTYSVIIMSQIRLFCLLFCHYYFPDSAILSIILSPSFQNIMPASCVKNHLTLSCHIMVSVDGL